MTIGLGSNIYYTDVEQHLIVIVIGTWQGRSP